MALVVDSSHFAAAVQYSQNLHIDVMRMAQERDNQTKPAAVCVSATHDGVARGCAHVRQALADARLENPTLEAIADAVSTILRGHVDASKLGAGRLIVSVTHECERMLVDIMASEYALDDVDLRVPRAAATEGLEDDGRPAAFEYVSEPLFVRDRLWQRHRLVFPESVDWELGSELN